MLVREGVNGRYFADGDLDDLTAKLSWFLEHPERAREMGRASVDIIRNEVNIHTVIRGYREALDAVCRDAPDRSGAGARA
jgi:glycosyltransferase involved in cell wall biosynthesis